MTALETTEEEYLIDETGQEQEEVLKESFPLPWADTVKEFEDYLLDIGVRI